MVNSLLLLNLVTASNTEDTAKGTISEPLKACARNQDCSAIELGSCCAIIELANASAETITLYKWSGTEEWMANIQLLESYGMPIARSTESINRCIPRESLKTRDQNGIYID